MLSAESFLYTIPILLLTIIVLRSQIYSYYDPFILTIFSITSSLGLMLYYYFEGYFSDLTYVFAFMLYHVLFVLGILISAQFARLIPKLHTVEWSEGRKKAIIYTSLSLAVLTYVVMAFTVGINILTENPEISRTVIYKNGNGISLRFFSVLVPILWYSTYLKSMVAKPLIKIFIRTFLVLLVLSVGGKGALFTIFNIVALSMIFRTRYLGIKLKNKFGILLFGAIVLIYAFFMMSYSLMVRYGIPFDQVSELAGEFFMIRIVAFGDVAMHYFGFHQFDSLIKTPGEYITLLLEQFFAPIHLMDRSIPIGAEMYSVSYNVTNEVQEGPNGQVFFVGSIYFGLVGGALYTFILSFITGLFKNYVDRSSNKTELDAYIFMAFNLFANQLAVDMTLAIPILQNWLFILILVLGLAFLVPLKKR